MSRAMAISLCFVWLVVPVVYGDGEAKMELTSPAFKNGEPIPDPYTCRGSNISPELGISNIPSETKSLALTLDDLDAPEGAWVQWVIHDIPPKTRTIEQNAKIGLEGLTDAGTFHYRGPCPMNKRVHRYAFRLYALSERLELNEGYIKSDLEQKMKGKILAQAELIGTYRNPDHYDE